MFIYRIKSTKIEFSHNNANSTGLHLINAICLVDSKMLLWGKIGEERPGKFKHYIDDLSVYSL